MTGQISLRVKLRALVRVVRHRPTLVAGVVALAVMAALLEGLGLGFLVPIIEVVQDGGQTGGIAAAFVAVYDAVGVPFTLEYIILGVGLVMVARYTTSFLVDWLLVVLRTEYVRHLQSESFAHALDAEIAYFDERGSDEILNNIVTQARYAGQAIERIVEIFQQSIICLVYVLIAVFIAPVLTVVSGIVLGGFLLVFRNRIESGYAVGDRVATANRQVHSAVQAGMQGIRDVKLFGMRAQVYSRFQDAVDQFESATIKLNRNQAAMDHFYQMVAALTVFGLIYGALRFSSLTLATLGLFLFAMFRLAPRASSLNNLLYQAEGDLPHLVRTQWFLDNLEERVESGDDWSEHVSPPVEHVAFEEVSFSYAEDEQVLADVSLTADRGDFLAFVGPSGTGKSTLVSLLTRFYDPDEGRIVADGTPIEEYPLSEWRNRVSVVRQQPHVFNDTLRFNLTIGNEEASMEEINRACEVSQVSEFLNDLPQGLDTVLGDDGIRLSGGQRQRVAIARALLSDGDILVLDEATSDLDTQLEQQVHHAVEQLDRDYIMFVIAHRLSTVVNADCIYMMQDGRIVESGTHETLIDDDGEYAELYSEAL